MKRCALLTLLALAACGESTKSISVELTTSAVAILNPYESANLASVRVVVEGSATGDDVIRDLDLSTRTATFEGISAESATVDVRAYGYDEVGNVVAYGERLRLDGEGDVSVSFPLHRNLAYIAHYANGEDRNDGVPAPESVLYVVDVVTRALVSKYELPAGAVARGVSARGGKQMLVTYEIGAVGYLGVISLADHGFTSIQLDGPQELALASEGSPVAVIGGGNLISFADVDAGTNLGRFAQGVGGRFLDGAMAADGDDAVFVIDQEPGTLFIDVGDMDVSARNVVAEPGGVGLRGGGDTVYFTSQGSNRVTAVELGNGNAISYEGGDATGNVAAYADGLSSVIAVRETTGRLDRVVALFLYLETDGKPSVQSNVLGDTLENPLSAVVDGAGTSVLIPARGSEESPPGLTVVVGRAITDAPALSTSLYPTDPVDTYTERDSEIVLRRRYQPRSAAIVYGR
ncbi:MAG: hypothetical protein RMA76_05645 [Deltaproteobacteria bacterium]|jgi:hypothetical protein